MTIIPISGFFSYKIGQSIRRKSKRSSIQIAEVMNIIKETLNNIKIVKIFNTEKRENEKFKNEINKYFHLIFRQARLSNLLTPINESIGLLVCILLIWFGGLNVLENQSMSPEDFIKFILLLFAMMQPIRKLANVNALFQNGIAAAERAFNIFDGSYIPLAGPEYDNGGRLPGPFLYFLLLEYLLSYKICDASLFLFFLILSPYLI